MDIYGIKSHYRSGKSDIGKQFFAPCLRNCVSYDRVSAYFSSSVLLSWSDALYRFVDGEPPTVRLLVAVLTNDRDKKALGELYSSDMRRRLIQEYSDRILEEIAIILESDTQEHAYRAAHVFAWLVATERLLLRFAWPATGNGALMHEKFGVFTFKETKIAFIGSANETRSGHHTNYESIDVYRQWAPGESERVEIKREQFEESWSGNAEGLISIEPSKEIFDRICAHGKSKHRGDTWDSVAETNLGFRLEIPSLWPHQREAVDAFLSNRRGIIEMATGTGKTRTAIAIILTLLERDQVASVLVTTNSKDILAQWYREIAAAIKQFADGLEFLVYRAFGTDNEIHDFAGTRTRRILLCSRNRLASAAPQLQRLFGANSLIVDDEVHELGAASLHTPLENLYAGCEWRLGLSATPERAYDEEGNQFIGHALGSTIYSYGLAEAIRDGILCEFDYEALEYELTQEDKARIKNVYAKQKARHESGNPMSREELWIELSRVYKTAQQKPFVFAKYADQNPSVMKNTIIFVEETEYANPILETLSQYTDRYRTYFSGEDSNSLKDFAKGKLDVLIACHRLSQGIDFPALQNVVILSSARSKLETIQRIGRVLRRNPDDPDKRAFVLDFRRRLDESTGGSELDADTERVGWLTQVAQTRCAVGRASGRRY